MSTGDPDEHYAGPFCLDDEEARRARDWRCGVKITIKYCTQ